MKIEGKNRGEEGTTPVTTACPEARKKNRAEKKIKKCCRVCGFRRHAITKGTVGEVYSHFH